MLQSVPGFFLICAPNFLMKKSALFIGLLAAAAVLLSWGAVGHRTVGKIAENHLDSKAKAAVRQLLGSQTLADVSTWPDEVRNQPEYRHTAPWHYVDLSLGMSYDEFSRHIQGMSQEN